MSGGAICRPCVCRCRCQCCDARMSTRSDPGSADGDEVGAESRSRSQKTLISSQRLLPDVRVSENAPHRTDFFSEKPSRQPARRPTAPNAPFLVGGRSATSAPSIRGPVDSKFRRRQKCSPRRLWRATGRAMSYAAHDEFPGT
ncbi:hypothetical protein BDZ90DRAFT_102687 [Jaminaea rosea]|uniref:Uncharacterized protein n=1 Tax=Jaminaea rosea TaxID=1569628 RepID=A0A316UL62_9BASI|nr:hypothetical protein BDZ90DRAFT_102687 [Jaminaea rosea]PWN24653.1 hypothetical protein BDZ90DRAFT_102687 [Jaminaea rosea]